MSLLCTLLLACTPPPPADLLPGQATQPAASRPAANPAGPQPDTDAVPPMWRRLAACESDGRWHLPHGPYSGGLQFAHSTWTGFGGGEFAAHAHLATPAEQVEVARRVLAAQGPGAWPYCSTVAGLR